VHKCFWQSLIGNQPVVSEEMSLKMWTDGRPMPDNGQRAITIAHPELCSGGTKIKYFQWQHTKLDYHDYSYTQNNLPLVKDNIHNLHLAVYNMCCHQDILGSHYISLLQAVELAASQTSLSVCCHGYTCLSWRHTWCHEDNSEHHLSSKRPGNTYKSKQFNFLCKASVLIF